MQIKIHLVNDIKVAEILYEGIVINDVSDALDIMSNCGYQGAAKIIVHEESFTPAFYDLKTGLLGEVLQKFVLYQYQLAIVGNFEKYPGNSLKAFIYESNKTGQVLFTPTVEEALQKFAGA